MSSDRSTRILGNQLRMYRAEVFQKDLAARLKVYQGTVSKLENSEDLPIEKILDYLRALNIPSATLYVHDAVVTITFGGKKHDTIA